MFGCDWIFVFFKSQFKSKHIAECAVLRWCVAQQHAPQHGLRLKTTQFCTFATERLNSSDFLQKTELFQHFETVRFMKSTIKAASETCSLL